jgi:hypothetical protein
LFRVFTVPGPNIIERVKAAAEKRRVSRAVNGDAADKKEEETKTEAADTKTEAIETKIEATCAVSHNTATQSLAQPLLPELDDNEVLHGEHQRPLHSKPKLQQEST